MRYLTFLLCVLLFVGCGGPRRDVSEDEKNLQDELKVPEESTEHKSPDGAFGAKDYANEARESSDRNTKALESAAEEQPVQQSDDQ